MQRLLAPAILCLLLLSFASCSFLEATFLPATPLTPNLAGTCNLLFDVTTPRALGSWPDRRSADVSGTTFAFGIMGSQSGILTAGNSAVTNTSMSYRVTTLAADGTTLLGSTGTAETFTIPDPSVISPSSIPAGTQVVPMYGKFLVRFGGSRSTELQLTKAPSGSGGSNSIEGTLTLVNEVVLRTTQYTEQLNGVKILTQPHFIVKDGAGTKTYSEEQGNLLLNGSSDGIAGLEYIFFVPSSVVGEGFTAFVHGAHTASEPVLNHWNEATGQWYPLDQWTTNPNWKTDAFGNEGLFAMIDQIAGTSVAQRASSTKWQSVADYFQGFFTKYYKSYATMFNMSHGLGNSGHSSFIVIALNDSNGGLTVGANDVISVEFKTEGVSYEIHGGTLNVVGKTPLNFQATIVKK